MSVRVPPTCITGYPTYGQRAQPKFLSYMKNWSENRIVCANSSLIKNQTDVIQQWDLACIGHSTINLIKIGLCVPNDTPIKKIVKKVRFFVCDKKSDHVC